MEIITLTKENLEQEHICCAISNNKDCQVSSKKGWLSERLDEGLMFKKGDVRGKCFIEYIPAEEAWAPIEAEGYMYINCLWVSGKFKGQGYSNLLLDECIEDSKAKGKKGLVILSSNKKRGFLSDPKYLKYKGFLVCDKAEPFFELMYLPFGESDSENISGGDAADALQSDFKAAPRFREHAKKPSTAESGWVLYYTAQCPFTAKYVPLVEAAAEERGVPFKSIKIESAREGQNAPAPFTTYCLFHDGEFITNEILSVNKFEKLLDSH